MIAAKDSTMPPKPKPPEDHEMEDRAFPERRTAPQPRFFRFDPTVSSGTLLQLVSIIALGAGAYGTYRGDQVQVRADITALQDASKADRVTMKETLADMRGDLRAVRDQGAQTALNVMEIKAQQNATAATTAAHAPQPATRRP